MLKKTGNSRINGQLLDAETYMTWFNELTRTLQQGSVANGVSLAKHGLRRVPGHSRYNAR
jgi:cobalamin biosynthesis Mg chelatase CobN